MPLNFWGGRRKARDDDLTNNGNVEQSVASVADLRKETRSGAFMDLARESTPVHFQRKFTKMESWLCDPVDSNAEHAELTHALRKEPGMVLVAIYTGNKLLQVQMQASLGAAPQLFAEPWPDKNVFRLSIDDEVPSDLPSIAASGLFMLTASPIKGYFMLTCVCSPAFALSASSPRTSKGLQLTRLSRGSQEQCWRINSGELQNAKHQSAVVHAKLQQVHSCLSSITAAFQARAHDTAAALSQQNQQMSSRIRELEELVKSRDAQLKVARAAAETRSQREMQGKDSTIAQLRAELIAAEQAADDKEMELLTDLDNLRCELEASKQETEDALQQAANAQKAAEQAQTVVRRKEAQLQLQQQEADMLEQRISELQAHLDEAKEQAENALQQVVNVRKQAEADMQQALEVERDLSEADAHNTELQTQLHDAEHVLQQAFKDKEDFERQLQTLQHQYRLSLQLLDSTTSQLQSERAKVARLQDDLQMARDDGTKHLARAAAALDNETRRQEEMESLKSTLIMREVQLQSLMGKLTDLNSTSQGGESMGLISMQALHSPQSSARPSQDEKFDEVMRKFGRLMPGGSPSTHQPFQPDSASSSMRGSNLHSRLSRDQHNSGFVHLARPESSWTSDKSAFNSQNLSQDLRHDLPPKHSGPLPFHKPLVKHSSLDRPARGESVMKSTKSRLSDERLDTASGGAIDQQMQGLVLQYSAPLPTGLTVATSNAKASQITSYNILPASDQGPFPKRFDQRLSDIKLGHQIKHIDFVADIEEDDTVLTLSPHAENPPQQMLLTDLNSIRSSERNCVRHSHESDDDS